MFSLYEHNELIHRRRVPRFRKYTLFATRHMRSVVRGDGLDQEEYL